MFSRKNISLTYKPNFNPIFYYSSLNLKNIHASVAQLGSFFIKKGSRRFFNNFLSQSFPYLFFRFRSARKLNRTQLRRFASLNLFFKKFEHGRAFTRFLYKFIRRRLRRVPAPMLVSYQRRRVLRHFARLAKGKRKFPLKALINELILILKQSPSSKVYQTRDLIHKQSEQARVYLRRPRRRKKTVRYISARKRRRLILRAKRRFKLRQSTVGMLKIKRLKSVQFKIEKIKTRFFYWLELCQKLKRRFNGSTFGLKKKIFIGFRFRKKITKKNRPWLTPYLYRQKRRAKRLRRRLFTRTIWRSLLTNFLTILFKSQ